MPGKKRAPAAGAALEVRVAQMVRALGLEAKRQVRVGRRIWGAIRRIDIVAGDAHGKRLGIECKFQKQRGTAEEKIPAIVDDIAAWPIDGIVVFDGDGFSENMKTFLISSGKAILFEDLEVWIRLYFGLPLK